MTIYRNARIFGPDFQFHKGSFVVENGLFGTVETEDGLVFSDAMSTGVNPASDITNDHAREQDEIDLAGATVIPGLVDVHSHGNSGEDFSDGNYEGLVKMARYYAQNGITSFAPTSMTLPYEVLRVAFANAKRLKMETEAQRLTGVSNMLGIHMEGPYFSYKKRGAQNPDYLKEPDAEGFKELQEDCGGLIAIVDVAPELPGAVDFARAVSQSCTVSVAHTDSDYEHAKAVYQAGARHLTHLYNAMPGIHHREPGVIGAASENPEVTAELICDGYHVHPAAVRLAFALFGSQRMVLISDSGRCAGMPEGSAFVLGGQKAFLKDGVGRLEDGTIACSAANLWDCMRNVISWGIPEEDALRAATYNPACAVGQTDRIGSIAPGRRADFVVTDTAYQSRQVYLAGKMKQ